MYDRLGYQWAGTLLASLGLACCLIPFLFWKFGARIRASSKYAYAGDEETTGSGNDSVDEEKARKSTSAPVRDDNETDEDLRRARSYVSNP